MIAILKVMTNYFTVMTDHGMINVDGTDQLCKLLENELDICIFDTQVEQKELDDLTEEFDGLKKKLDELKKKRKGDKKP